MTFAIITWLELIVTVGSVFAAFFAFVFGLLWYWNH